MAELKQDLQRLVLERATEFWLEVSQSKALRQNFRFP